MDVTLTTEIDASVLVEAGQLLHGREWKAALARDLGLGKSATRLLDRWTAAAHRGERVRVSRSMLEELADIVEREGRRHLIEHGQAAAKLRTASEARDD